jgi:hypothetical protein
MFLSNVIWSVFNAVIGGIFSNLAGSPIIIGNNVISAFITNILGL